jgi:hypothetical protein
MFHYDIRTADSAIDTLARFTAGKCCSADDIWAFYDAHGKSYEIFAEFISEYKPLLDVPISEIVVFATHFTSNNDACNSIKEHGLRDLQFALANETPLKKFLSTHGIEFDIKQCTISANGAVHNITFNCYEHENLITHISRKIYYDNKMSYFLHICDVNEYGGDVHKRPEILNNIDEFLGSKLAEEWEKISTQYEIDFTVPLLRIRGLKICDDDDITINSLLELALNVAKEAIENDCIFTQGIFGYLDSDIAVTKDNIISIK